MIEDWVFIESVYTRHKINWTQDAHVKEKAQKTNEQHLGDDGDIDEEAIKISRPAAEPDKKLAYGQDTQLLLTGHSRYFKLIVVSLSNLKVSTSRVDITT